MQNKEYEEIHYPVLKKQVLEALNLEDAHLNSNSRKKIIDATLGLAGYGIEIVKRGHLLLGIDADKQSLKLARRRLEKACPADELNTRRPYILVHANFTDLESIALENDFSKSDAVIFDLGISNLQLKNAKRGFSFAQKDADLDMRIDKTKNSVKAADLVNLLSKKQLTALFSQVMRKDLSRKLAFAIVQERKTLNINTVGDFLQIINKVHLPKRPGLNIATLPFMALRIAVNSELQNLKTVLPQAFSVLKKSGKLLVISFHSGEDRIVKTYFRNLEAQKKAKVVTKKPIVSDEREKSENPPSRSAKLRIIKKI